MILGNEAQRRTLQHRASWLALWTCLEAADHFGGMLSNIKRLVALRPTRLAKAALWHPAPQGADSSMDF